MNDTFVVGVKPPQPKAPERPVNFPQIPVRRGGPKVWLRRRMLGFLGLE